MKWYPVIVSFICELIHASSLSISFRRALTVLQIKRSPSPEPSCPREVIASSYNLPQEVTDIILDLLSGDRTALKQCSLVCRAWVPRSTAHLFSIFYWPQCNYPVYSSPQRQQCGGEHSFDLCLQILENSSRMRMAIKELRLGRHWHYCENADLATNSLRNTIPLDILHSILSVLPCLRRLRLQYCITTPACSGQRPPQGQFTLDEAHLLHTEPSLQSTCDLLTLFDCINELHLVWDPDTVAPAATRPVIAPTTAIHALDLPYDADPEGAEIPCALDSLRGTIDPSSVRAFSMRGALRPTYIAALMPYAPSLTTLAYMAHRDFPATALPDCLRPTILCIYDGHIPSVMTPAVPQRPFTWNQSIIVRDLDHLIHADTREVYIEVPLPINYLDDHPVHADIVRACLRRSFAALDWTSLYRIFSRCPSFTRLLLGLGCASWLGDGRSEVIELAVKTLRELARERLPAWMIGKVVVTRHRGDVVDWAHGGLLNPTM